MNTRANKDGLRPGRGSEVDKTGLTLCQSLKYTRLAAQVIYTDMTGTLYKNEQIMTNLLFLKICVTSTGENLSKVAFGHSDAPVKISSKSIEK